MNFYSINLEDHAKTSWVLHETIKTLPPRPKVKELAPVFYKFFRSADTQVRMKPQYFHLVCKKCGRYDADRMFEVGFTDPVTIRFKGDYGFTSDRIFAVSDKFLKVLKRAGVRGYESKPIGKSRWHALRVTQLVKHIDGVVKSQKPLCPNCGRPEECYGLFKYLNQLSLPADRKTLFATQSSWPSYPFSDRQIFITEDALLALKGGGILGGYCTRLWTDNEEEKQKDKARQGINFWKPPKTFINLNGKKSTK